ncbi:putative Ig domain-containing protein [Candidatus Latescibacterota bacterium]
MPSRASVLSILLVCLAATPSQSVRFYVDRDPARGDDRRSVMSAQDPETPFRSITHALRVAHLVKQGRPHVIQIAGGTYTPKDEDYPLSISQTRIYIESEGNVVLDAQRQANHFEITAPTSDFVLKDMAFTNGEADSGGVVYCHSCSLRVVDSRFIGNRASDCGDIVCQRDGRLEFNNNVVRYNGSTDSEGALIEIHNTFVDLSQRDVIRNNTFYLNEAPAILTSGNRTDISSNIFYGLKGEGIPALIDSASEGPLVRYNLFWDTDVLLVGEGADSISVLRTERDTVTLEESGVQVPDFFTNTPDTLATVQELYVYDMQVEGDKSQYRFSPLTFPDGTSEDTIEDEGIIRWTPTVADVGRHEFRIEVISPVGRLRYLTYNVRVYTAESFPDTTDKGPTITVTFVPDTTGAIDSLDARVPVFSSALSAGGNLYDDPLFVNPTINRFELLAVSVARNNGNPIVAMEDPREAGRTHANDIGDTGGPLNDGPSAEGTRNELTISSLPDSVATEGQPWVYDPVVLEGGTFYRIDVQHGPTTMADSFGVTPPVTWTPSIADTGSHLVGLITYTSKGSGRQYFPLHVRPDNEPPNILSTAPTQAFEDAPLTYAISASDPNDDDFFFTVEAGPEELTVSEAGLVEWLPTQDDVGVAQVQVRVTDVRGASRLHSFSLAVENTNDAPVIASVADTAAVEDETISFVVVASDIDAFDSLTYTIASGPSGASIDAGGVFSWTPAQADVGPQQITIQVTDLAGVQASTSFAITVVEVDDSPLITSSPPTEAAEDIPYIYQVVAEDEEVASLTYSLAAGPEGMVIDADGTIEWTPTAADVGTSTVTVDVADASDQVTTHSYDLTVAAVNDLPVIEARVPQDTLVAVSPGTEVEFSVEATDEETSVLSFEWLVDGSVQAETGASLMLAAGAADVDTVVARILDGTDTTATEWWLDGRDIARVSLSPAAVDFGSVALGATGSAVVQVENGGSSTLELANLLVGNIEFDASFGPVGPTGSTQLDIRFVPGTRGSKASTVQFDTNDPDHPTAVIDVSGVAVVPTELSLDLDPEAGNQAVLTGTASAGDQVSLDVYATGSLDLVSYRLVVAFDPALAQFREFDLRGPEGTSLLEQGGNNVVPTVASPADGLVQVAVAASADPTGVTGDGLLGRLTFDLDSAVMATSQLSLGLVRGELTSQGQAVADTLLAAAALVDISPLLPGDFDGDGIVGLEDLFMFAVHFGGTDPVYDLDGDGLVGLEDLFIFAVRFGTTVARPASTPGEPQEGLELWPSNDGEAMAVDLEIAWSGGPRLWGFALGVQYDPVDLRFAGYRGRDDPGLLTWVVDDEPGWVLVVAGATKDMPPLGPGLGELTFERRGAAGAVVRPLTAMGYLEGTDGPVNRPLRAPDAVVIEGLPSSFALHPAYPNPFNPETVLAFDLASDGPVVLRILDLLGRPVASLVDDIRAPGRHTVVWAGQDDDGRPVAAGVYLVEMRATDYQQIRKLMLLK